MSAPRRWSIGFDLGGTYIDLVACADDGAVHLAKHPLGDAPLADAALGAVRALLEAAGIEPAKVERVVHGTTLVTNLLLEHDAPPVAVITTRGFADVLTLGRQSRADLYQAVARAPVSTAPFPRPLRFELGGRLDAAGREVEPLDEAEVIAVASELLARSVKSVAVCLLFSPICPAHENRVAELLARAAPGLAVSLSHRVDPGLREFERSLATALDAYAKPVVGAYLAELAQGLETMGLPALEAMRSDGATAARGQVLERPLTLAASGPAATLTGLARLGRRQTHQAKPGPLLALDIGGTTSDIGFVTDAGPQLSDTLEIGAQRLRLRCADVSSIPVGGGSVATLHAGDALRLGPRSQGARPGPACYAQGGDLPTLSDALLLLGRLPARLSGGIELDAAAAQRVIGRLAAGSGRAPADMARACVAAAGAAIAEGIRMHAFRRGVDPADCVLVAAGGGGGQHAAEAAELAGVTRVRVLPESGVVGALGLLLGDPGDAIETPVEARLADLPLETLVRAVADAVPAQWQDAEHCWRLAIDYEGQDAPIEIEFDPRSDDRRALAARFESRHTELRGRSLAAAPFVRRLSLALRRRLATPRPALGSNAGNETRIGAWGDAPLAGAGPRLLVAATTSAWVPPGWRWQIAADGVLELERTEPVAQPAGNGAEPAARFDWATLEPLRLALQGAVDRMQEALSSGAFSTIAREGGDCAAALFLPDGRLLAQARSLPLLLGSLAPAVQAVCERFPVAAMREGDGFLLNDPWCGGSHLPDLTLVAPIVHDGRAIALGAAVLHHQDVGGISPGSIPANASSIFHEGLRLPPVRSHRDGRIDAGIEAVLRANSRTPDTLIGDLGAQWAAIALGAREFGLLAVRYGASVHAACAALLAQSEQMTRTALAAAPDGSWCWDDRLDGDGITDAPVPLHLQLDKRGDSVRIDFTGSAAQTPGPVNASPASVLSAALYFMRTLAPEAPNNAGCLEPLELHLPPGSIVNPAHPAAVNARTATVKLACNAILGAWGLGEPALSVAANAGVATVLAIGGTRDDGSPFLLTEIIASGAAASSQGPGAPGISTDVGNARNTPAEVIETRTPVRLECYEIRTDSGGEGRHRGGDGVRRVYRLLEGRAQVSYRGERHTSRAQGVHGGAAGAPSCARVLRADGRTEPLGARAQFEMHAGDRLLIETAGAGGWGAPADQPAP